MDTRLNLFENPAAVKAGKYINSAVRAIHESALPRAAQELVNLRASQINGCGIRMNVIVHQPAGDYQPGLA